MRAYRGTLPTPATSFGWTAIFVETCEIGEILSDLVFSRLVKMGQESSQISPIGFSKTNLKHGV